MLVDKRIYLASQSPRRRELLKQIGVAFDVLPLRAVPGRMDVVEVPHAGEAAIDFAQRMASEKAACGWRAVDARRLLRFPVLGADTVVELDGAILGKPADRAEAESMLTRLSGRVHRVHTAVAMQHEARFELRLSSSTVRFATLDAAAIAHAHTHAGEVAGGLDEAEVVAELGVVGGLRLVDAEELRRLAQGDRHLRRHAGEVLPLGVRLGDARRLVVEALVDNDLARAGDAHGAPGVGGEERLHDVLVLLCLPRGEGVGDRRDAGVVGVAHEQVEAHVDGDGVGVVHPDRRVPLRRVHARVAPDHGQEDVGRRERRERCGGGEEGDGGESGCRSSAHGGPP